jgi:IS30 family transposase
MKIHANAALTIHQRQEIRRLLLRGASICDLAAQFHVNPTTVSRCTHRDDPYDRSIHVAQESGRQAERVGAGLRGHTSPVAQWLLKQLETFVPRLEQVVCQAWRRVMAGETVPAKEKRVSLFEPHT